MAARDSASSEVRIFVDGKARRVPASSTVLEALISAGHEYLADCGCRRGACGECAVLVRAPDDPRPVSLLACQTPVRPDLRISKIPFQWNRAFAARRRGRA